MPTNPYTEQNDTGFNASPPPDDGSQTSANEITWAGIKTKLADPILAFVEAVDDAVAAAFAKVINTDADENNAMGGSLAFTESELTITTGAVTVTRTAHSIDTESDAASDDLDTLTASSVSTGAWLLIRANNAARTVVVKHSTGNILTADDADFTMDDDQKFMLLQYNGTNWQEISRSSPVSYASQAQQEAGSSTTVAVSPGTQQYHDSALKGWGSVTWSGGTPTLNDSYNVSGIVDDAAGRITFTWDTDFSSVNYCVVAMGKRDAAGNLDINAGIDSTASNPAVGACAVAFNIGASGADPTVGCVMASGDQ